MKTRVYQAVPTLQLLSEVVLVSSFSISGAATGLPKHIIISPFTAMKQKKEQNYCKHSYYTVSNMINLSKLKNGGFSKSMCLFFSLC